LPLKHFSSPIKSNQYLNIAATKCLWLKISFKILCFFILGCFAFEGAMSQISISGTIYDSTKVIAVSGAEIISSSGTRAVSDSFGKYHIIAAEKDSLSFIYNGKTTAKFAVSQVENPGAFDISLHIRIREKYKMLKEVRVFTRSYREDSIENRTRYASIFNY
jgi:hypothetical protein